MFNPYFLLAGVVFAIGLFGSGVSIGYKWSERAHVAALAAAQVEAITGANLVAEAEKQRALAAAKKEADARLAARTARMKGELDAAKKSRPECARDAESTRLLHDAINAANDKANPGDKLPDEVRPSPISSGWERIIREKLGVSNSGAVRGLSPPAQ